MKKLILGLLVLVFTLGVSCKKEIEIKKEQTLKAKEHEGGHTQSCKMSQAQGNGCTGNCGFPPPEDGGNGEE